MVSLKDIDIGKKCRIVNIEVDDSILRRFMDVGLVLGAVIEKILISPFGGISAYSVMGSVIAIRDNDIGGIMVEYE